MTRVVPRRACAAGLALPRSALLVALVSCGGPDRFVVSYPHPEGAQAEAVGFPPPPAQIETLSKDPPAAGCLWADGQWVWVAQRWDWRPGGWILPPEGCRHSAPTASWALGPDGTSVLYYRPGRWYSVSESRVCPEPVSCPTSLTGPAHP